ncbi:hypothetical protein AMEX_G17963 [Astyanax mexicanus]|uniref:Uncharacterized protein n=1 Tax=Astyanax mexicanus TaxID=7994 RepID=A0A8T2LJ91_ASTMX|nr:hypothetical protein AMEX_G17963 [Astyanax mexicanus]
MQNSAFIIWHVHQHFELLQLLSGGFGSTDLQDHQSSQICCPTGSAQCRSERQGRTPAADTHTSSPEHLPVSRPSPPRPPASALL